MTDPDAWMFAYGSNLDRSQKEDRTGTIREARVCKLPGFRLAFNKRSITHGAAANVVPHADSEVWGVAFLCDPEAVEKMDDYEKGYRQFRVLLQERSGKNLEAFTYIAESSSLCDKCSPSAAYVERIVVGGKHWNLPNEYIASVLALAGASRTG